MRAFNLTVPTSDPSIQNAIQAGSLSHTGNSFRPIASPLPPTKIVANAPFQNGPSTVAPRANPVRPVANPVRRSPTVAPRANPVAPVTRQQGVNGAIVTTVTTPSAFPAHPVAPIQTYRGIIGN